MTVAAAGLPQCAIGLIMISANLNHPYHAAYRIANELPRTCPAHSQLYRSRAPCGIISEPYWNDLLQTSYKLAGFDPVWQDVGPERQEYIDEWGNTWARLDRSSKGEVVKGALASWEQLDSLVLPDLANPLNFQLVAEACEENAGQRYVIGHLPGFPFNIARKLRRLDLFLMDILLEKERVGPSQANTGPPGPNDYLLCHQRRRCRHVS